MHQGRSRRDAATERSVAVTSPKLSSTAIQGERIGKHGLYPSIPLFFSIADEEYLSGLDHLKSDKLYCYKEYIMRKSFQVLHSDFKNMLLGDFL